MPFYRSQTIRQHMNEIIDSSQFLKKENINNTHQNVAIDILLTLIHNKKTK